VIVLQVEGVILAHIGNARGIGQGFGQMGEIAFHLFRALVIQLPAFKAHAFLIIHLGLGLYAQEHIMRFSVVSIEVVAVIGRHYGQRELFRYLEQGLVGLNLFAQTIGLQLQIEAAGIDIRIGPGHFQSGVHAFAHVYAGHFAGNAGREGYYAF